jgi:hypothetical protein
MSTLYDRLVDVAGTRLSVVIGAAANLKAQLSELNALREQVRKAELSAHHPRMELAIAEPFGAGSARA